MTASQILHYGRLKIIMKKQNSILSLQIAYYVISSIYYKNPERGSHCIKLTGENGIHIKVSIVMLLRVLFIIWKI